jgi:hypothetical protein
LDEPFKDPEVDVSKPHAEIGVVDDSPNILVLLGERAYKNQKYRQRKQHDGES